NTLVILDGLDERTLASNKIVQAAEELNYKLLLTARPLDIAPVRALADIQVEHRGLDTKHRDNFINHALRMSATNTAQGLISFIQKHKLSQQAESVIPMAHVPVILRLLCTLWQHEGSAMDRWNAPVSLSVLYRALTNHVWGRFRAEQLTRDRPQVYTEQHRDIFFQALEQAALTSLKKGKISMDPITLTGIGRGNAYEILARSGLLLLKKVESTGVSAQCEFPHLTFQEHFAGRALARQFLLGQRNEVKEFLKRYMCMPQCRRALLFMAGEILQGMPQDLHKSPRGVIRELLQLVNLIPREPAGFQHLILQLRLLNEWLLITGPKEHFKTMQGLEKAFGIGKGLGTWFKQILLYYREDVASTHLPLHTLLGLLSESSGINKHYSDRLIALAHSALKGWGY
ncbi:MAG: hypothetical protein AAFU83_04680, partial [Bacteroidota bacterium]